MSLFKKKKSQTNESTNPWKEKFEALEKDYKYLKSVRNKDILDATEKAKISFSQEINVLHKEVAYWKEKALNFKKFHQ